jgi:hypothetical protein
MDLATGTFTNAAPFRKLEMMQLMEKTRNLKMKSLVNSKPLAFRMMTSTFF